LILLKLNKISYVNEYSVPTFISKNKLQGIPFEIIEKYINKKMETDEKGNTMFLTEKGNKFHFSELSYGERKIIFILSAVYSEKSEIILLDLPENGLSLTIQSKIINEITNKGIQLIVATHAPYIYDDSISNGLFLNELKM